MKSRAALVAALLALTVAVAAHAADPTFDAFERSITEELRAIDADAVPLLVAANAARERNDHATAARLFAEVFARAPSFIHAERRLCFELVLIGRRDEGIAHCRHAISVDSNAYNVTMLASALLEGSSALSPSENREIDDLLEQAEKLAPQDPMVGLTQCNLALRRRSAVKLKECTARLQRIAPNAPGTIYMSWIAAMTEGRWSAAADLIARGRKEGLPADMLAHMEQGLAENRPWTDRVAYAAGYAAAGWALFMLALVGTGILLSQATLRHVEAWSTSPRASTKGGNLRSIYQVVIFVSCAAYYVSLPLLLVFVAGGGSALIYGMFAMGRIPIKAVAIIGLLVFWTCTAAIRSLFFRPSDDEPGLKLDLAREPKLAATLEEVAARVGTRRVDTVYMTPGTQIAVFERGRGERCLLLGPAALDGMSLRSFQAILAHEYGHFSNRDTAGGGFALRVRRSILLFIVGLAEAGQARPWNPAWWFAKGFYLVFLRISQGASRLQEILADRHAAEAYGGQAFADGLRHVIDRSVFFDGRLKTEVDRAKKEQTPLRNLWSGSDSGHESAADEIEQAMNREPSPYDSHPAPRDRIRWVEHLKPADGVTLTQDREGDTAEEQTVWDLFSARAEYEKEMTLLVHERLVAAGVSLVPPPGADKLPSRRAPSRDGW